MIIISILSFIRYWFREWYLSSSQWSIKNFLPKTYKLSSYDSIWFEGSATYFGKRFNKLTSQKS